MKLLTKEHQKYSENQRICYIFHKKFENKYLKDENVVKLEIIVILLTNIEMLSIAYVF